MTGSAVSDPEPLSSFISAARSRRREEDRKRRWIGFGPARRSRRSSGGRQQPASTGRQTTSAAFALGTLWLIARRCRRETASGPDRRRRRRSNIRARPALPASERSAMVEAWPTANRCRTACYPQQPRSRLADEGIDGDGSSPVWRSPMTSRGYPIGIRLSIASSRSASAHAPIARMMPGFTSTRLRLTSFSGPLPSIGLPSASTTRRDPADRRSTIAAVRRTTSPS